MEHVDPLFGWTQINDRPSVNELNRALAKQRRLERVFLIESVAMKVPGFRVPSHLFTTEGRFTGLTFVKLSGSVLLTFPERWPANPARRIARLYTMGNANEEDISSVVVGFHDQFEAVTLPAEAHAADGG